MSIISEVALDSNLKTQVEGEYNLSLGETWEQHLANYLTASGLPAYRANQRFVKSKHLNQRKFWLDSIEEGFYDDASCPLKVNSHSYAHSVRQMLKPNFKPHPKYEVLAGHPLTDSSLLRPHQRDVMVKISPTKRLSVEVKALTPKAFDRAYIQVGDCGKYDKKAFRIDALVLINQATGEAFVSTGDTAEMHRQRSASNDGTYSYAIEKASLKPLDAWIGATKDIYGVG